MLIGGDWAMLHYRAQGIHEFEERLSQIKNKRGYAPDSNKMTMRVRCRNNALLHFSRNLRGIAIAAAMMHSLAVDAATAVDEAPGDVLMVQLSAYTQHFHASSDYSGHPWLVGAEWQRRSNWLAGYSYFNNSFNQKCHYIYGGYLLPLGENYRNWYVKLTGGLILGYKDPYEDKLPINWNGVAPVIIPGLGYKFDRFNVQLNMLGTNGLMLTVGYDLFR